VAGNLGIAVTYSNPTIRTFRDLVAWQKAYSLGLEVYQFTLGLPTDERFSLVSQLRRGAISISSNIAEGYGRGGRADYTRFLKIARGALYELDTQVSFCVDLRYASAETYQQLKVLIDECERILAGLIRSLEHPQT
jgi:four helix bundle protein